MPREDFWTPKHMSQPQYLVLTPFIIMMIAKEQLASGYHDDYNLQNNLHQGTMMTTTEQLCIRVPR